MPFAFEFGIFHAARLAVGYQHEVFARLRHDYERFARIVSRKTYHYIADLHTNLVYSVNISGAPSVIITVFS